MTTGKTIALTRWTFVGKVMSLLLNMLSRLVITFLPRSKHLLISWLQSLSAVILKPPKIKSDTVSIVSPSICLYEDHGIQSHHFMANRWGSGRDFIFWGSKITVDNDCSHEIKRCLLLGRKAITKLDSVLKRRDITDKGPSSQSYGFSSSHVWM